MSDFGNNNDLPGYGYDEFSGNSGNFSQTQTENYGYDVFNTAAKNYSSYDGAATAGARDYSQATGFENIKNIATEKVVAKSFIFMFVALLITAFASLTTSPYTAARMLSGGGFFILLIAEIAIVLISNAALKKNNVILAGVLYTIYSFITGMTLSVIYVIYAGSSIASVFFITAAMFGSLAVFGLVTKKDLTSVGSICMMGLWGIILASVINLFFLKSNTFDLIVSVIGVLVFVGLTAYDTQKIKQMCAYSTVENENSLALFGAFQLYLDFINLFLKLLRILGRRK
ncbi:MAG: Bax inhibitor-1/YccA family protein [Lachnospiraceae bacterium]|nr:Bax inhibitor-1/YccA family protein [Lachnospiraceae bacterium]